ncbi:MAG: choice-of-anchor I family protein [bacterium]
MKLAHGFPPVSFRHFGITLVLLILVRYPSFAFSQHFELKLLGSYHTGVFAQGAAEIAAFDPASKRLFFVNANAATVDILDLSDPAQPVKIASINAAAYGAVANSVGVKNGVVAVAIEASPKQNPGQVVFFDINGDFISAVTVGALPDALVFTPDGSKVVVANEGEPSTDYVADPEGSVSIIDLSGGAAYPVVSTASFTTFIGQEAQLRSQGIRIYGPNANAAQDFEPEYAAISEDSKTAYVTLQENNTLAVVDLNTATVTALLPLGFKDHSAAGNGLDGSDRDGGINLKNWPVLGMYLPDAIVALTIEGQTYLVTVNEGDTREYTAYIEEARIGAVTLDSTAFPNGAELKRNTDLGRLKITSTMGDVDGDGDYDKLYTFGARSFSIWDTNGNLVYDSGDDFERLTAQLLPGAFNSDNAANNSLDSRSDDKGPEPEALAVGWINGRACAFIGVERIGGVFVYDVTNPRAPVFLTYANNRNFSVAFAAATITPEQLETIGDLGPESVLHVAASESPNGSDLLVVANEISGSVSIFQIVALRSLAEARQSNAGSTLTVQGVVTRARGRLARIQDDTGAIAIFQSSGAFRTAIANGEVRSGDLLRVSGRITPFNGLLEIDTITAFEVLSRDHALPEPQLVSLNELAANGEAYESKLIYLNDLSLNNLGDAAFQANKNYPLSDASNNSGLVTLSTFGGSDIDIAGRSVPAKTFDFKGVLGDFNGSFQIIPVEATDLIEVSYPALAVAASPKAIFERNGVTVFNGGFGSGMAPHPYLDGYFYLMTDRGPNFESTLAGQLIFPVPGFAPQIGLFRIEGDSLRAAKIIDLKDAEGNLLTGLPNPAGQGSTGETAIDLDGNVIAADPDGLDPEGVVALSDGSFWISDEYGPHILHVDANGRTVERVNPFGTGTGGRKLPRVFSRRRPNRGMEGLTITPDGATLVGIMQSALDNPFEDRTNIRNTSRVTRILSFDIASGATRQYIYLQEAPNLANSEIIALSSDEFYVLERDGNFPGSASAPALYKRVYKINLSGATDVSDPADSASGLLVNNKTLEQLSVEELSAAGIVPVSKTVVLDILASVPGYAHDKPEGIALVKENLLAVVNDDDFGIATDGQGGIVPKLLPRTGQIDRNAMYFVGLSGAVGVAENRANALPKKFELAQNYPNPFNPTTNIAYALPAGAHVQLAVYDVLGRRIATLVNELQQAGTYSVRFEASRLGSGLYFYRLEAGTLTKVRKMLLAR